MFRNETPDFSIKSDEVVNGKLKLFKAIFARLERVGVFCALRIMHRMEDYRLNALPDRTLFIVRFGKKIL